MKTSIFSSSNGLTSSEWRRQGQPSWWLRRGTEGGDFVQVPEIDGRREFSAVLDLEPGIYQLGTGKKPGRTIREKIEVVPCAAGCGRGTEKRLERMVGTTEELAALGVPPHSFCRACDQAVLAGIVFGGHANFSESARALKALCESLPAPAHEAAAALLATPAAAAGAGEWG